MFFVPADSELRMTASEGLIYYTTDGSDPRLEGGNVNPSAMTYDPTTIDTTPIASGDFWKYHDQGIDLGESWRQPSFDDAGWSDGNSPLGFGNGGEATVVFFGNDGDANYRDDLDHNGDGSVDLFDFAAFRGSFGT